MIEEETQIDFDWCEQENKDVFNIQDQFQLKTFSLQAIL